MPDAKSTELDQILDVLAKQNSNLVSSIAELEKIGHRVKNTDHPIEAKQSDPKPSPDGLIQSIREQLGYYEGHNNRLRIFIEKIQPLL